LPRGFPCPIGLRSVAVRIAEVIGTITLNSVHQSMVGARFKLAVPLSWDDLAAEKRDCPDFRQGQSAATAGENGTVPLSAKPAEPLEEIVVMDELGAGIGSRIAMSEGREAAMPFHPEVKPVDAYNAAILDTLEYEPIK
jgi:microcompartment protein CcmK/EutM